MKAAGRRRAATPKIGREILYLSGSDVLACGITPAEVNAIVEASFLAKAERRAVAAPTLTLAHPSGDRFVVKGGIAGEPAYAAIKWFGVKGKQRPSASAPRPLAVLSELESGHPVAFMDAGWITAARTASITAVAAKYMARTGSSRAGFIACGAQARSNLAALRAVFPIGEVVAFSRRGATAAAFRDEIRRDGLRAEAVADARDAVSDVDIVVTSVPPQSMPNGFLRADWLAPGSFVSMVDRGFSWDPSTLGALDKVITDDLDLSGPRGPEKLVFRGDTAGELAEIVSGALPGRQSDAERNAIAFSGLGLADAVTTIAVYERALAGGLGTILPL